MFYFLDMFLILPWVERIVPESCHCPVSLRIGQFFISSKDLFARLHFIAENLLQMHVFLNTYYRISGIS